MIHQNIADSKVWRKSQKLKGFVKDETIRKYLKKNYKSGQNKTRMSPRYLIWGFLIFCGSILLYHCYTLWRDYTPLPPQPVKSHFGQQGKQRHFLSPLEIKETALQRAQIPDVQSVAPVILLPHNGDSSKGAQRKTET
jgi:hypothetical protein